MKVFLSDTVRLPLKISRGGDIKRYKLAESLNKMLYDELAIYGEKNCPVNAFKKALDKIIGKFNIKYSIQKLSDDSVAGSITPRVKMKSETTAVVDNYLIEFPIKRNKIVSKATALHEARHLFDFICNPKTIDKSRLTLKSNPILLDKYEKVSDFLDRYFDKDMDLVKLEKAVKILLMDIPDKFVVKILNSAKHSLKTEFNAYTQELKFLSKSKSDIDDINRIRRMIKAGKFQEKLKIVNKLLREKLAEMWSKRHNQLPII